MRHPCNRVVLNFALAICGGPREERSSIPEDVVIIVPGYRRYKYFVFEDKVVIVDPDTYAIVDVLILA